MTSGIQDASANCGNGANPKSSDEMGIEHIGGSHAANCGNCANLAWKAVDARPFRPKGAVQRKGQQKMQKITNQAPAVHALLRQNREAAARTGTYGTSPSKPLCRATSCGRWADPHGTKKLP